MISIDRHEQSMITSIAVVIVAAAAAASAATAAAVFAVDIHFQPR